MPLLAANYPPATPAHFPPEIEFPRELQPRPTGPDGENPIFSTVFAGFPQLQQTGVSAILNKAIPVQPAVATATTRWYDKNRRKQWQGFARWIF